MFCIKLINTNTSQSIYWKKDGSIRTMDMSKAKWIAARLLEEMSLTTGNKWTVSIVPVEEYLMNESISA